MKYFTKVLFLLLVGGFFSSCEKQEYFKSESEIEKELAFSWKQELVSLDTNVFSKYEIWNFSDGSVSIITRNVSNNSPIDTVYGNYRIKTSLTKVFVKVSDFPNHEGSYFYNSEWTVVILDNKILVIASEDPRAGGVQQRDFTRID